MSETPVLVLGGSGYVAGELLRLVAQHPGLRLSAAVSSSQVDEPISAAFPHLAPAYAEERFASVDSAIARLSEAPHWALLSAAPHGASAQLVDRFLAAAENVGSKINVVDASADFRFASAEAFERVYRHDHPAPGRLMDFTCAVPEHLGRIETPHAAHPGCFATAILLGIVPLLACDLASEEFFVSAVTGSTGAGRTPRETTHHPVRQSNLFAYQPLTHRHDPEVRALAAAATGKDIELHFVPHSGPFARGIHATVLARPRDSLREEQAVEALTEFYRHSTFVRVQSSPPRLKDVVASGYAALSVNIEEGAIVVCCVLDNLLKGAASGSIQWLNRLLGWPEPSGIGLPSAGWI
jgi:N-acetyl-gamma-glutamyl-phosphate reductase common form